MTDATVKIRRQPDSWKIGAVPYEKLNELRWSKVSGGVDRKSVV